MKIGYARVSTRDQTTNLQLDALRAAGCERIYEEAGSGAKAVRPQLDECIRSLRPGDMLVVWRLDRLGRSMKHLVEVVTRLDAMQVNFSSITEGIDTSTPMGRFAYHLFGSLAEFELHIIRERVSAGLDAARARGRKGGRPAKLSLKDLAFADKALLDPNMTITEVAERLGVTRQTLASHLKKFRAANIFARPEEFR